MGTPQRESVRIAGNCSAVLVFDLSGTRTSASVVLLHLSHSCTNTATRAFANINSPKLLPTDMEQCLAYLRN